MKIRREDFYIEPGIINLLKGKAVELGINKSGLLRIILKKHFGRCCTDGCVNSSYNRIYCNVHSKKFGETQK